MWPHDDTVAKNAYYGNFQAPGWQDLNLMHLMPPFLMKYQGQPMLHGILVHKKISSALLAAFTDIATACDHDQAMIDKTGASDFGGCFNIRSIAGSDNWSNHSWACAIDLSPASNGFNMTGTIAPLVVTAFKKQGFLWGGDYVGRKDKMHFEAVSR